MRGASQTQEWGWAVPDRQVPNKAALPFSTGGTMPVERTSTVSSVARRLLDELGSGSFAPGTRLPAERELAGTLQAPIVKLARTLNEIPGKFVRTLAAVRDAKEKPAG